MWKLFAVLPLFFCLAEEKPPSIEEIVARNLKARGGIERLRSVRTQRLAGRISFGPGNSGGPFEVEIKRPGMMRQQFTLGEKTLVMTTNGVTGWSLQTGEDARPLTAGELKNMAGGADFDGPLLDWQAKGNRIEFGGPADVEGSKTWKLIITQKSGEVRTDFIDAHTWLELKWQGRVGEPGHDVLMESLFRDYRPVDGVQYAFTIDSRTVGSENTQKLVFERIFVNPALDDARFGKP